MDSADYKKYADRQKEKATRKATANKRAIKKTTKKTTQRSVLLLLALPLILFYAVITVNEAVFRIKYIPSWFEIYSCIGSATGSDNTKSINKADFGSVSLKDGEVTVYYFDVGQGDSALILTNKESILIDCGEKEYYGRVYNDLRNLGVTKLTAAIMSHPDSDHCGGFANIINAFQPTVFYMPELSADAIPDTKVYSDILDALDDNDTKVKELSIAEANSRLPLANGAYIEFLAPDYYYSDTNNSSIVCKLIHGENEFLFTGDIEKKAEKNLLADGEDVSADVLKVPHHGSDTSSTEQFLEAVNGQAAIISVGSPNSYGHPKQAVLDRLTALGYVILRTDELGNIGFLSDGVGVKYKTEK